METTVVNREELLDVLQHVNLIKVKFGFDDVWVVTPVIYASDSVINVLVEPDKIGCIAQAGDKVMFKFQRYGYEYLVSCEIEEIGDSCPATMAIRMGESQKCINLRRFMRFDTDLKVAVKDRKTDKIVYGKIRNVSRGGAMAVLSENFDTDASLEIEITFDSGNHFMSTTKILRKSIFTENSFGYGLQFLDLSNRDNKIINKEISRFEKDYLRSLKILRKYNQNDSTTFNSRVVVFSYDNDESFEAREGLVRLGAENFDVFQNFKFYVDFFTEENPNIVIIDAVSLDNSIIETIKNIREGFPEIYVILMLPMEPENMNQNPDVVKIVHELVYKPLIYNEFEEIIIKYL